MENTTLSPNEKLRQLIFIVALAEVDTVKIGTDPLLSQIDITEEKIFERLRQCDKDITDKNFMLEPELTAEIMNHSTVLDAIGTSLIIIYSNSAKVLNKHFLTMKEKATLNCNTEHFSKKIGNYYWSQTLKAASNYVRHYSEWRDAANSKYAQEWAQDKNHIIEYDQYEHCFTNEQKRNIPQILELGINAHDILAPSKYNPFEIAKSLGLTSDTAIEELTTWITDYDDYLETQIEKYI